MEVTGKPRWPRVIRGYGYNHCGFPAGMDSEQPFDRGYGFNSEIRGYFQPKNYLTHGKVHSSWFKQSIAASDLYRLWHTVLNLALQLYKYSLWTRRSIYDKQRWSLVNRTYRNYLILKVNDCLMKTLMGKALSGNSLHEWRLMMHQIVSGCAGTSGSTSGQHIVRKNVFTGWPYFGGQKVPVEWGLCWWIAVPAWADKITVQ